ncbi:hypothetical protein M8R20_00390 [Pseudomonas sp. R2.Fl]|nr:hypothetical protein [Pseudomonas sp. R2.Fl]
MKTGLVLALTAALAGCGQTAGDGSAKPVADTTPPTAEAPVAKSASARDVKVAKTACEEAVQQQMNAAAVGGALGMVGGFGGFGGRGGAVAANVASSAGSMIAQQQAAKQSAEIERNCY